MKILLTGATGFLGRNMYEALLAAGHDLVTTSRDAADKQIPVTFEGDLLNESFFIRAAAGCDVIIHAAADTSMRKTKKDHKENFNFLAAGNLLTASERNNIKKIIYISSVNTIGPGTKKMPATEENPFAYEHLDSGYIHSKYVAEELIRKEARKTDASLIVLNPSLMLGKYCSENGSGRIISHFLRNNIILCPSGGKNFVHVKDIANATLAALDLTGKEESFIISNENLNYREFYHRVALVSGLKRSYCPVNSKLLQGISLVNTFLKKAPELNPSNAYMLSNGNYYSNKKALSVLRYDPIPLDIAISDAVDWLQSK